MEPMTEVGQSLGKEMVIASDAAEARRVQEEIEQFLRRYQFSDRDVFAVRLALEEALINAIKHGNQMDRTKNVRVAFRLSSDRFEIRIDDEGSGFNPEDVPDPTAVENLERPCGRGIMLMRHYMSTVSYIGRGNSVAMTKLRNGAL
jgi:serine/threonine-protein kinase RsbW